MFIAELFDRMLRFSRKLFIYVHTDIIYREKSKTFKIFGIFNRRFSYFINRQNFYFTIQFQFRARAKVAREKEKSGSLAN